MRTSAARAGALRPVPPRARSGRLRRLHSRPAAHPTNRSGADPAPARGSAGPAAGSGGVSTTSAAASRSPEPAACGRLPPRRAARRGRRRRYGGLPQGSTAAPRASRSRDGRRPFSGSASSPDYPRGHVVDSVHDPSVKRENTFGRSAVASAPACTGGGAGWSSGRSPPGGGLTTLNSPFPSKRRSGAPARRVVHRAVAEMVEQRVGVLVVLLVLEVTGAFVAWSTGSSSSTASHI
jgi:hypothetical protein